MAPMNPIRLSEEIMEDILSRLPVKCLMRFRSVCKSWPSLFRKQHFIAQHHRYQTLKSNKTFIVKHGEKDGQEGLTILSSTNPYIIDDQMTISVDTMFAPFKNRLCESGTPIMLGPVNGLLCICDDDRDLIVLCNPATRELRVIPSPPIKALPDSRRAWFSNIGFGFDNKTNDYKIVRFVRCESHEGAFKERVELYSLMKDSWRDIPYIDVITFEMKSLLNPYMNGVYYWFAKCEGLSVVLSFNFVDEVFDKLSLEHLNEIDGNCTQLMVINGLLSLVFHSDNNDDEELVFTWVDMWSRTENGGKQSWETHDFYPVSGSYNRPVGVWGNRWFLEDEDRQLALLEQPKSNCKQPHPHNLGLYASKAEALQVAHYVETLVLVNFLKFSASQSSVANLDETAYDDLGCWCC